MTTTDGGKTDDGHDETQGIPDHVVVAAQVGAADAASQDRRLRFACLLHTTHSTDLCLIGWGQ